MKLIIFFQLIISVSYAGKVKKLIGGSLARIEHFPHQISIRYLNKHLCGGAIITNRHLITSASCLSAKRTVFYSNLEILSGTSDQSNFDRNNNIHSVELIIFHPQYNPKKFWNHNIAIIRVSTLITFKKSRFPVKLPHNRLPDRTYVQTSGWGQLMSQNIPSYTRYLRKIKMQIQSQSECRNYFPALNCYQGCAKMTHPPSGISKGDGGSGVIMKDAKVLVGIISIYSPITGFPALMTKIYPYLSFIQTTLEKF